MGYKNSEPAEDEQELHRNSPRNGGDDFKLVVTGLRLEADKVEERQLRNQVLLDSEGQDRIIFTKEEIKRALQEIKNKKAP